MAYLPWRFQADVKPGDTDPAVTVFFGPERAVLDDQGNPTAETFVEQATADPVTMPMSQLAANIDDPAAMEEARVAAQSIRKRGV